MVIFASYNNASMKRIISALIISLILATACSDETSLTPGISFITSEPEILEETAIFRVIGQPFLSIDSLVIPVVFGGDAERGVDYDASADQFKFKGESLMDSIVISTKQLGTGKKLSLTLQIPEGFVAGKYASSEFTLQDKYGYLSFESAKSFIADTTSYLVTLNDSNGKSKVLSKDAVVSISVNKEKSTAVEGEDFELIDADSLVIAAGEQYAEFGVALKGSYPRDRKDKIVLNVNESDKFSAGKKSEIELNILRSELKVLDGSWTIDTLVTDSVYFKNLWGDQCADYTTVPEFNSSDKFEFSFLYGYFDPNFRSGLKNYFTGDSFFTFEDTMEITDPAGRIKTVQLMTFDNTNRYFSSKETSEDNLSYVGIYLYQEEADEETGKAGRDMMEFYILDHTSKGFMPELESGGVYGTEKPVAADPKLYMCTTFIKK